MLNVLCILNSEHQQSRTYLTIEVNSQQIIPQASEKANGIMGIKSLLAIINNSP